MGGHPHHARILVIDDDEPMGRMIGVTLRSGGHRVTVAHDSQTGLERVESERPDVIVLDLHQPGMDGRTFCKELRRRGIDTPVMIVSTHEAGLAHREVSAQASISKPFRADDLADKVEAMLAAARSA